MLVFLRWIPLSLILCGCLSSCSTGYPTMTSSSHVRDPTTPFSGHGDLLSGKKIFSALMENVDKKKKKDEEDLDQKAEPSFTIAEIRKIGFQKRNLPNNKIVENSFHLSQRQRNGLDVDDPVFGSRQPQKLGNQYHYHNPIAKLSSIVRDRYDNSGESIFPKRNSSRPALVENDFKTNVVDRNHQFRHRDVESSTATSSPSSSSSLFDQKVTQSIIALGESRSYSYATNIQPPSLTDHPPKEMEDNQISVNPSDVLTEVFKKVAVANSKIAPTSTFPDVVTSTEENSITTIVHSQGEGERVHSYSWSTGTRWSPSLKEPEKIISVRVSSSVGTSSQLHNTFPARKKEDQPSQADPEENAFTTTRGLTLLTEKQARVTAVQRSQFSVEESMPKASDTAEYNPQISPVGYLGSEPSEPLGSRLRFFSDRTRYSKKQAEDARVIDEKSFDSHGSTAPGFSTSEQAQGEIKAEATSNEKIDFSVSTIAETQSIHEARSESVSCSTESSSEECQNSQVQEDFGKRLNDSTPAASSYLAKKENATVALVDQGSYEYTNIHDQGYHHVQVTHYSPESQIGSSEEPADNKKESRFLSLRRNYGTAEKMYGLPEENYEIDESVSVMTNGRAHGVQSHLTTESSKDKKDSNKFGYVVEGRNFRKYRVEERTSDGFIVGEYGVVRHDDGSLRGVRYTADSTINPRLIYDALVKFLSL